MPVVSLPSTSATQTVAPPYTINTPIKVLPADPSLATFTAANPFVGTIRSAGFHDSRDPMLHQFNFDIQYPVDRRRSCSKLPTAERSDAISRRCSSTRTRFRLRRRLTGNNKQANRPFPYINGTVIPTFSTARTTTTRSTSAWRSATRRASRCW